MAYKTEKQLSHSFLNDEDILRIYKQLKVEFGRCSLGRVQDYLKRKGILNPVTRKPPSRQAILLSLRRTEEGRALVSEASHTHYLDRPTYGWPEEREHQNKPILEVRADA